MTNSPMTDEAQSVVDVPAVPEQAGVGEKEAEAMSNETEDQRRIEAVAEALEKRLRANPISQPDKKVAGWKAAGLIIAVLTAIATPVLTITWFMSTKMEKLDNMCEEVKEVKDTSYQTRRDVQLLREAFIAHTMTVLPFVMADRMRPPALALPDPPDLPPSSEWRPPLPQSETALDPMSPTMIENILARPEGSQQLRHIGP